jgi:hypothetical protein
MFHRVTVEEWHQITPIISFGLTFAVFIAAVLRALLTRRERCRQLSALPLDEEKPSDRPQA